MASACNANADIACAVSAPSALLKLRSCAPENLGVATEKRAIDETRRTKTVTRCITMPAVYWIRLAFPFPEYLPHPRQLFLREPLLIHQVRKQLDRRATVNLVQYALQCRFPRRL